MKKYSVFIWTFIICTQLFASNLEVKTIFGSLTLENELLKIYNLQHIQRLKSLDQTGSPVYWNGTPKISRLDNGLAMLWLVQKFGGDLQEQISALTCDISQTVFSQTADVVFGKANYQESIREWFLHQTTIHEIISGHDWAEKDIISTNPKFKRLLPQSPDDMCARNIAYILNTSLIFKMITENDVQFIISKLRFEEDKWCFINKKAAKKFASLSLALTKGLLGSSDMLVIYHITSRTLKRAIQLQRITENEVHFGTDKQILDKLNACDDREITRLIAKAKIPKTAYRVLKDGEGTPDFVPKPTFSGIDPWIYNKFSKKFKRLSETDGKFKKQFFKVKEFCAKGYKIQLNID